MEQRRKADRGLRGQIKRIRTELSMVAFCCVILAFLPREAIIGVISLFITKTLFTVIGILVAHSSRKFLFPYLDLQAQIKDHHWPAVIFMILWYGVIIWAFAAGG